MQPHLASTDAQTMQALMFGGVDGVPRRAGYTIGFSLVQAYLEAHPGLSVASMMPEIGRLACWQAGVRNRSLAEFSLSSLADVYGMKVPTDPETEPGSLPSLDSQATSPAR